MIFIQQAKTDIEKKTALLLMLSRVGDQSEQTKIANELFDSSQTGEVDLTHLYLAYSSEEKTIPVAAIYFLIQADSSALVWPPVTLKTDPSRTESAVDELLKQTSIIIEKNTCWIGQILIEPEFKTDRERLERNGFTHLTDLEFLKSSLDSFDKKVSQKNSPLKVSHFQPHNNEKRFESLLARTYVESTDCPEIAGYRTPRQAFIGHQMSGTVDPMLWRIYSRDQEDVAVLLLTKHSENNDYEISYLGVVPEARGQGLARQILEEEMNTAKQAGIASFSLALDARNVAAKTLYGNLGFQQTMIRSLHAYLPKISSEKN